MVVKALKYGIPILTKVTLIFLLLNPAFFTSYGQAPSYQWYYRVYFRDKGANVPENYSGGDLLSARAIERRQKAGILMPDFRDIPVSSDYLDEISSRGFILHCKSRWMNTALFKTETLTDISILLDLSFVSDVKIVKKPITKSTSSDKLRISAESAENIPYDRPISMVNGSPLHNSGFDGKGILIAVLDGGFTNANYISSLAELRSRKGIIATYDFLKKNEFVYGFHNHGTAVLSVLAGKINGELAGTAPGANYLLLKTEDVLSEFPCEEDFWAAGAEFADSAGADIISSSLGYFNFDDPAMDYKFSDLDGNTAFITRIADIAASKGILVVNSAGNERENEWKHIICPADGDSVIAVGAVDGNNYISTFSSAGPSFDRRIKPDNCAMGVSVPLQTDINSVIRANGTSFSCPVLSGMAACLLQAVPRSINADVIEALHISADRYNTPDSLYGYGIPDMITALLKLQEKYVRLPDDATSVSPNPSSGDIEIVFNEPPQNMSVEIISLSGRILYRHYFTGYAGSTLILTELKNKEQGIYLLRLITGSGITVHKIIKLRN
jgi:serine protease AprX